MSKIDWKDKEAVKAYDRERIAKWREAHPEYPEKRKNRYQTDEAFREHAKTYAREYRKTRPEYLEKARARYHADPEYRAAQVERGRVWRARKHTEREAQAVAQFLADALAKMEAENGQSDL